MVEWVTKVAEFIQGHWEFLSAVLGVLLGWFHATGKFHAWLESSEEKYRATKKWARGKDLYKVAKTAYGVISKLSRKTETTLDDKAARGLEEAMKLMEHLGWDKSELGNGEKDIVLKVFEELHENEHLALEASKGPVSNRAAGPGEIAAPLVEGDF
jgi:hypothetical protein